MGQETLTEGKLLINSSNVFVDLRAVYVLETDKSCSPGQPCCSAMPEMVIAGDWFPSTY